MPRLQNEEGDSLTNSEFRHFDMKKRVKVDLKALPFLVLNLLVAEGDSYVQDVEALRMKVAERVRGGGERRPKRRKAQGGSLREKDPWAS